MVFRIDTLVADGPEVFSEERYFDEGEFILQKVDVIDYFSEDEV